MKKHTLIILSTVLLSSTVACNHKQNDQAANGNKIAATSSQPRNQQASVPAGTSFDTILQEELSTGKNHEQDRFTLRTKTSLLGGNPTLKDAVIQGHLEDLVKAARGQKASVHLVFDDIVLKDGGVYPLNVTLVNTQVETKTQGKFIQNAGIILGGAVAGHFLGNKANFKHGALAGGAAATAFALSSPGGEVVLKKGTDLKLKLKTALDTTP